jgi:hypothetical protein
MGGNFFPPVKKIATIQYRPGAYFTSKNEMAKIEQISKISARAVK